MSLEKTSAIVLRVVEFSETSCIVTMLTRDYGKITAMAKGARRPKSSFEAALDVLAICRIVFLSKSSGAMDLLTEAKLERRFRCAATNLDRLYAGYYVAELLTKLTDDKDPHQDLFDLSIETIQNIDCAPNTQETNKELDRLVLNFELNALRSLGHLPMLTRCVNCGREKRTLNRVSFGMNAGGILCRQCRAGERNVISLSSQGLAYLLAQTNDHLPTSPPTTVTPNPAELEHLDVACEATSANHLLDAKHNLALCIPPQPLGNAEGDPNAPLAEVRALLRSYITHLLGYPPRLQNFLKTNSIPTRKSTCDRGINSIER